MRPWAVAAIALAACATPSLLWRGPSDPQWPALQQSLEAMRDARPKQPWAAGVRATLRHAPTGRQLEARGGLAVAPGRGLRMILVAGPGSTALDVWVTPDHWRVSAPPMDLLRRGGVDAPPDLPVGFLRWWFFGALAGTLSGVATEGGHAVWRLQDRGAVLELHEGGCDGGRQLHVVRRADGHAEEVEECRAGALPAPGDRVGRRGRFPGGETALQFRIVDE